MSKIRKGILSLILVMALLLTNISSSFKIISVKATSENATESLATETITEPQSNEVVEVNSNLLTNASQDDPNAYDYVREPVQTVDAMPAIESALSGYRLGGVQTLANDGHIGISVELSVYYKSSSNVTKGPNGTPIILYVVNTSTVRTGTKSDVEIISSMLSRNYVVVLLNYKFNSKAVSPALEWSAQSIRNKMMNGEFFNGLSKFTSGGTYYETFIVPAGYDVSLNHVYWEFDKHGADGTFDKIIEVWNTDFRKDKGETIIKWTDASGNKKAVQNDFSGNKPSWCNADGTANANGQYIKVKFTKAQTITDCVKKDGSPIDLNLYMHLIYPTNPKKAVPVMALNSSSEHLAKGSATLDRPQMPGFAFNGYASVMYDFGYTPMARDDHYSLFQPVVTGDSLSYAVHFYSDKLIGTAAMRYIRYLSLSRSEFNFDTNAIGVFGNSKGGWVTYLGEEQPQNFKSERMIKGHHGETRYENNLRTDNGVIDGGEVQPWLTYNGKTIDSGADFVYASCGGLEENITYGHAPTYISCNKGDTYNSYYTSSNGFVNMCRIYDIPSLWFETSNGHTFASGYDLNYGLDTYPILYDFANFYLKKEPVKLLYTDITNAEKEVSLTKEIFFMFSGGVSLDQVQKLTPINTKGEIAEGEWVGSYGGTHWTFYPKFLDSNEIYTLSIPKTFYGTNKVRIEQEHSFYFTTKYAEVTQNQFVATTKGTYAWFEVGNANQEYKLYAHIKENANNRLQLYKVTNFNSSNPDSSTIGELIQEKVVYKSGNIEFNLTDYCKSYSKGTKLAFLLKQSKVGQNVQGMNITFDNGNYGGLQIAGKIVHEASTAPDGSTALKIVEMQPNNQYTSMEEIYDNITTVAAKHGPIKAGTNNVLTNSDLGRKFKISFRVYDTCSRTMQAYIKSPTSNTDEISDYNWVVKNFYTEPNKWVNVELEYVIYEPYLYPQKQWGIPSMLIKAAAMGNIDSPYYIDSLSAVEIVDDIIIDSVSVEGASVSVDLGNVPTSQSLANSSISAITQKSHPYILYENSEISELKNKIKSGYSKKAFTYVEKSAKSYLNASLDMSKGIVGRQLQSYVAYLNTYSILTDNTQYKTKAIELVMSAVNSGTVDSYYATNGALCVADFGYAYALAYDWLYSNMTTSQRNSLKAEMISIGEWIYNLSINPTDKDPWGVETNERRAWNWNAVTHGALGMIALSLGDSAYSNWLTRSIDRVKSYYTFAVDTQGAAFEGLHYIGYALNTLSVLDDTIYNLTQVEILDYYPHFYNLTNWSMRMTTPFGNEQASIGQGTKLDNYSSTFYLINKKHQRLELWGWEKTYNLHNGGGFTSDYQGNGFNAPNIIFFEDQSLTPLAPTNSLPLVTSYDKGIVLARDGWEQHNSLMSFHSGWGWSGTWNHPDNNTFTFFAKGESFVIDLGANFKTSLEHNIVQVDGTGFYYTAPSMIAGHITTHKNLNNGALYLKGDNSDSYRDTVLTESTRQMIYKGGDTPYVIAFDYVNAGTASHTYTTNFFTDYDSTVTIENSGRAKIVGGNNGGVGYAFVYSPNGASFTTNKDTTKKTQAIVSSNKAVTHTQATLFTTQMTNGQAPTVTWSTVNGNVQVSIKYLDNSSEITDTYIFYSHNEVSVSTKSVNIHTHSLTHVAYKAPTCTENGNIEYYACAGCGKNFTDSTAKIVVDSVVINATHNPTYVSAKESTCSEKGHIAHYKCLSCGNTYSDSACKNQIVSVETALKLHNYGNWIYEISPTTSTTGTKGHFHCSSCGGNFDKNYTEIKDLTIPVLPQTSTSSSTTSSSTSSSSVSSSTNSTSSSNTSSSSSIVSSSQSSSSSSSTTSSGQEIVSSSQSSSSSYKELPSNTQSTNINNNSGCKSSIGNGLYILIPLALFLAIKLFKKSKE